MATMVEKARGAAAFSAGGQEIREITNRSAVFLYPANERE